MSVQLFRARPVVIEAVRWEGDVEAILAFAGDCAYYGYPPSFARDCAHFGITPPSSIWICPRGDDLRANVGDWIVKGVTGEFYPCRPDIFEATYEPALPAEGGQG